MSNLFHILLTQPLFNALIGFYNTIAFNDMGLAIILLTIAVRFVLYPLFYHGLKNQAMMQKIQPEIEEIQKKHKDDKEKQALEMMAVWKKHKVNPFSGFLLLLVQLPIILAIYRVFLDGVSSKALEGLYSFISAPEVLNNSLFGIVDLSSKSMVIVVLATAAAYIQGRMAIPKNNSKSAQMGKKMSLIAPAIILVILLNFSSAIGLYILTTTVFSIFQQAVINKKIHGSTA